MPIKIYNQMKYYILIIIQVENIYIQQKDIKYYDIYFIYILMSYKSHNFLLINVKIIREDR